MHLLLRAPGDRQSQTPAVHPSAAGVQTPHASTGAAALPPSSSLVLHAMRASAAALMNMTAGAAAAAQEQQRCPLALPRTCCHHCWCGWLLLQVCQQRLHAVDGLCWRMAMLTTQQQAPAGKSGTRLLKLNWPRLSAVNHWPAPLPRQLSLPVSTPSTIQDTATTAHLALSTE